MRDICIGFDQEEFDTPYKRVEVSERDGKEMAVLQAEEQHLDPAVAELDFDLSDRSSDQVGADHRTDEFIDVLNAAVDEHIWKLDCRHARAACSIIELAFNKTF